MKKNLSTIVSVILSLIFVCIMLFAMLEGIDILYAKNGLAAMIFTIIDFAILITFFGFGRPISKTIGTVTYIPACIVTVIYEAIAFFTTFVYVDTITSFSFMLRKIILLFVFICIIASLVLFGLNTNKDEDKKPEVKKHNI